MEGREERKEEEEREGRVSRGKVCDMCQWTERYGKGREEGGREASKRKKKIQER